MPYIMLEQYAQCLHPDLRPYAIAYARMIWGFTNKAPDYKHLLAYGYATRLDEIRTEIRSWK